MMRAYSLTRIPEYRFERQFQLRPRLRAAGYARQAAHAGGFQRKGGGSAVRLYPLPGCLPDHAGRACASIKAARIRCAARTGGICHGGSIARYAGGAWALCQGVWAELQRAARRRSRRIEKSDAGFSRALRQNSRRAIRRARDGTYGRKLCVRSARTVTRVCAVWTKAGVVDARSALAVERKDQYLEPVHGL